MLLMGNTPLPTMSGSPLKGRKFFLIYTQHAKNYRISPPLGGLDGQKGWRLLVAEGGGLEGEKSG
jgi:hypothetical protein